MSGTPKAMEIATRVLLQRDEIVIESRHPGSKCNRWAGAVLRSRSHPSIPGRIFRRGPAVDRATDCGAKVARSSSGTSCSSTTTMPLVCSDKVQALVEVG
jgi:hypothetical protein